MYAIVKTGGKQYKVAADDIIEVEKLSAQPGETVELEVVFVADGSSATTDADALLKAKVFATVVEQFKGDKQIIFKFKKRKGYKRLKGHRQNLTKLKIDAISLDGKKPKVTKKAESSSSASDKTAAATKAAGTEKKVAAEKPESTEAATTKDVEKKPVRKTAVKKVAESDTATEEEKPKPKTRTTRAKAKADTAPADEGAEKASPENSDEDKTEE